MVAYTGYSLDTIKMCKETLIKKKLIQIVDNYYILSEQVCVAPSIGKLTKDIEAKYIEALPSKVRAMLGNTELPQEKLRSGSGATQDYINININNDINNNNNVEAKYSKRDVELVKRLFATVAQNFPNYKKLANRVPKDGDFREMNKLHRIDGNDYELIESVLTWLFKGYKATGDFDWKDQIKSVGNLRKHFDSLRRQYEKDKSSGKYRPYAWGSMPKKKHGMPLPKPEEKHVHISPEEAEKNRIILDLVRQKKATFSDMKSLKSKTIDELRKL